MFYVVAMFLLACITGLSGGTAWVLWHGGWPKSAVAIAVMGLIILSCVAIDTKDDKKS